MSLNDQNDPLTFGRQLSERVLQPMKDAFVGKDEIIDLMGVCLIAGENLFLLGPPGTAKSALVRELARRLEGQVFDYLLTRFTEPNELFGPFDIRRLREGELVTNTEGMLPEASLVFLDELLNANSAILNSLLMALNERIFRRGRETRPIPALMFVGASNHLPEDAALGALFDRFLMRVRCDNVPQERLEQVLGAGWRLDLGLDSGPNGQTSPLHLDEVRRLHRMLSGVSLDRVRREYVDLVGKLRGAGIPVSDRRAVKLQRLVAASALICGRRAANVTDLWVLRHIWDTEEQQEVIAALVQETLSRGSEADRAAAHPRSSDGAAPDPDELDRDLERLGEQAAAGDEAARAIARDRLRLLASRTQWVRAQQPREHLQKKIDALWERLGTA